MEERVHEQLSRFLAQHSLQDAVSNIDEIVLSYLLGLLDLIGQEEVEDCFDLEDVMDMMNAYLPGFDQIHRSTVMDWMFNVAAQLKDPEPDITGSKEDTQSSHDKESQEEEGKEDDDKCDVNIPPFQQRTSTFPLYDYKHSAEEEYKCAKEQNGINGTDDKQNHIHASTTGRKQSAVSLEKKEKKLPLNKADHSTVTPSALDDNSVQSSMYSTFKEQEKEQKSKRKKRYLSCSSQDSLEDSSKSQVDQTDLDECLLRDLLEMFPAACSLEAKHCLHVSNGDLNMAAQLIMDRQESGQAITQLQARAAKQKNQRKSKKTTDFKLDDKTIKSSVLEKYSFYDVAEDEKTHKPPPLKHEAKKLVRYRDGQIVSMKGERFSEIKKS